RTSASAGGFEQLVVSNVEPPGSRRRSQASRFMLVLLYVDRGQSISWHGACCILLTMIRRRLSLQLTLVMLLVALAPLAGAGILILNLIEQSITTQVKTSQEQMASAAGALVRNYLNSATTKLKSISAMMHKDEDFPAQMDRLNAQIEPPDLFLEIGYWARNKTDVEVVANAQQLEYSNAQSAARPSSRSFNPRL